jgi:predicted nucleic acid-binding protein
MKVFVDTSALMALLDASDLRHRDAARIWAPLIDSDADLETHNYVVIESTAVVQRRLGNKSLPPLLDGLLPLIRVVWVDEEIHRRAVGAMRAARSGLSLVDGVSFEIMRLRTSEAAFAFDRHFGEHGFSTLKP